MTEPIEIKNCEDDDILSFGNEVCKISKFRQRLWEAFDQYSSPLIHTLKGQLGGIHDLSINPNSNWFYVGKECEILKQGQKWQNGKIKFKLILKFNPDQLHSLEENRYNCQNINDVENCKMKNCANEDVLCFQEKACKSNIFRQNVWESFDANSNSITSRLQQRLSIPSLDIGRLLFIEGKECSLLRPNQEWQKGKIKVNIILEFIPDEPEPIEENGNHEMNDSNESPLDEIRQQLTTKN